MPKGSEDVFNRRKFIIENVIRLRRKLWQREIVQEFPGTNNQSINDDMKFLNRLGLGIQSDKAGREVFFFDSEAPHTILSVMRREVRKKQKDLVASAIVGLICGYPQDLPRGDGTPRNAEELPDYIKKVPNRASIDRALSRCARECEVKVREIRLALHDFWSEQNRIVSIDAGTTNDRAANLLKDIEVPSPYSSLSSLTVCTNSRLIFQTLGDPGVPIKTIVVGGQQRLITEAIVGGLAELFLRTAALLHFGVAVVGCTAIDAARGVCCSDTQEEANLKTLMFQKSSLRVAAVDNSKLTFKPMRESYRFAAINPHQIDLLITNSPVKAELVEDSEEKRRCTDEHKNFRTLVNMIECRGVPVLVVEDSTTEPFSRGE